MKKILLGSAALVSGLVLTGCGANVAFTRLGEPLKAKPTDCEIEVLSAAPSEPYRELGTLTMQYPSQTAWIDKEAKFKKAVRPTVCNAGGDAVIGHTNDYGVYLTGTVISLKPDAEPEADKKKAASGGEAPSSEEAAGDEAGADAI